MKRLLIVSIHGIRTGQTAKAWQEQFKFFIFERSDKSGTVGPSIETLERQYWAGIFPPFNVFIENHFLAAELADEVLEYLDAPDEPEVCFLSHSNGADIAVKTMQILARRGKKIKAAVFIAGAISEVITKNGVFKLTESGALGKAVSYSSGWDRALSIPIIWPYGRLGLRGFRLTASDYARATVTDKISNRYFSGYDHCTYFDAAHETETFNQVLEDLS